MSGVSKFLKWILRFRRSSYWEPILPFFPVQLITGEVTKEIVMTRWIEGTRQYRRATDEEVLNFLDRDAW